MKSAADPGGTYLTTYINVFYLFEMHEKLREINIWLVVV